VKKVEVDEKRIEIYQRDDYKCQFQGCNKRGAENLELAHRINKGKTAHKYVQNYIQDKYKVRLSTACVSRFFVNHSLNLVSSCRAHNDYFNIFFNPEATNQLIDKIYEIEKSNFVM